MGGFFPFLQTLRACEAAVTRSTSSRKFPHNQSKASTNPRILLRLSFCSIFGHTLMSSTYSVACFILVLYLTHSQSAKNLTRLTLVLVKAWKALGKCMNTRHPMVVHSGVLYVEASGGRVCILHLGAGQSVFALSPSGPWKCAESKCVCACVCVCAPTYGGGFCFGDIPPLSPPCHSHVSVPVGLRASALSTRSPRPLMPV